MYGCFASQPRQMPGLQEGYSMLHELKIWPQYYARVADGSKTFEIRENDRGFQPGDTVTLMEFDPTPINATSSSPKGYTDSAHLKFKIGYVYVLDHSRVVFSLLPLPKPPPKKARKTRKKSKA